MKLHHDVDATTLRKTKRVIVATAIAAAVAVPVVAPTQTTTQAKALHDTCWGRFC